MRKNVLLLMLGVLLVVPTTGYADQLINLAVTPFPNTILEPDTAGNVVIGGSAIWASIDQQPTGTGTFEPFLRFQASGTETGLNSDNAAATYDDKAGIWTHSELMSRLGTVTNPVVNGVTRTGTFYFFTLDFNETKTDPGQWLALNALKIYTVSNSAGGSLTTLAAVQGAAGSTLRYDLGNDRVLMNYALANAGSGEADIEFFVPFFSANANDFLYFYNQAGNCTTGAFPPNCGPTPNGLGDWGADDGFEEWHALLGPGVTPVPEPGTLLLLGSGLVGLGGMVRRRNRK